MATQNTGFPPARPIEEMLQYIQSTEVYNALKPLPKGGNLHSHEGFQYLFCNTKYNKQCSTMIVLSSPSFFLPSGFFPCVRQSVLNFHTVRQPTWFCHPLSDCFPSPPSHPFRTQTSSYLLSVALPSSSSHLLPTLLTLPVPPFLFVFFQFCCS